jgi:hypothetical protein
MVNFFMIETILDYRTLAISYRQAQYASPPADRKDTGIMAEYKGERAPSKDSRGL